MYKKTINKNNNNKKNSKIYFTQATEDAIVLYNSLDPIKDEYKRNLIFEKQIYWPFKKIVENLIHKYKFYYFDSLKDIEYETITFLTTKIDRFNPDLGNKAFSYFSVVAKNYLIMANNKNYKKLKTHRNISTYKKSEMNYINEEISRKFNQIEINNKNSERYQNIINELIEYLEENLDNIFKKQRDKDICIAIIEILKIYDGISMLHKKAIYVLIREYLLLTKLSSVYISNVLKKIHIIYKNLSDEYIEYTDELFLS